MRIEQLVEDSYRNSEEHGFWDDAEEMIKIGHKDWMFRYIIPTKLDLIVSEASEALDNVRDGTLEQGKLLWYNESGKPEGFASEIADAIIRLCDVAGYLGIDLEYVLEEKHRYNQSRPLKHGKTI